MNGNIMLNSTSACKRIYPLVPCNIGEINQVVLNLIVNGAHAIRDRISEGQKGNIVVSTKYYADAQCVVIR